MFYLLVHKLVRGGQGETEEAGNALFVGGRLSNKGTYLGSLSWVATRQVHLCTCLLVLKVFTEALTGFSHTYNPYGVNTLLSQGYVFGTAPTVGS